jgi:transcriptional regulator with GAF, ATPase, and Fis domain
MLMEMIERLLQTRTFEQIVHTILDDAIIFHGAQYGNVQLRADDHLVIAAQRGFTTAFLERFKRVKVNDGCACGRALYVQRPVVIADVETDADFAAYRNDAKEAGFRSVQSTPLITKDKKLLGIISTHFAAPCNPSEDKFHVLPHYGTIAADHAYKLLGNVTLATKAAQMSNEVYSALDFPRHDSHSSGMRLDGRGSFQIATPARFRAMAEECDRLAAEAETEEHRKTLREIGQAWRKLEQEADTTI